MLKSLFATCLTALSVNTQSLVPSRSIEPSRAISSDTTFNVGDIVLLSFDFVPSSSEEELELYLFANGDSENDTLKFLSFNLPIGIEYFVTASTIPLSTLDYCSFLVTASPNASISIFNLDDATNDVFFNIELTPKSNFTFTATFEILVGFEGFNTDAFPFLTKVDNPYTPPAKSNLYRLLYDFYYSIFSDDDLATISTGYNMPFDNWLAHTCTIATLLTLIVVAFFFLRWLFKVISGLILLKR